MSNNKAYAQQLKGMGYERRIIAFKRCNEVPEKVDLMVMLYPSSVQSRLKSGKMDNVPYTLPTKMCSAEGHSILASGLTG